MKSHAPWVAFEAPKFKANKLIIIVRNPTESCISWLHLLCMATHSVKIPFPIEKIYPNFW